MGKAKKLEDLINTLDLNPICDNSSSKADYYVDTSAARGSDASAYIEYLLSVSKIVNKKFLFAGHSGSGKSTELFKLSERIKDKYFVVYFSISEYVNFVDVSCPDLVVSMLKTLIDTVEKCGMDIDPACIDNIVTYWNTEATMVNTDESVCETSSELGVGGSVFNLISSKIKALFQQSNTIKTETTTRIDKSMHTFLKLINQFIEEIKLKIDGKELLIIVDDLDKLNEKEAFDIFKDHSIVLTGINANIIYTFPVFMHYYSDYNYIQMNFHESIILSMIMVNNRDGSEYSLGREVLEQIVLKRADKTLFADGCIKFAILKSGGSIRNMLKILRVAAVNAGLRCEKALLKGNDNEPRIVTQEDLDIAYRDFKNSIRRFTKFEHLEVLKKVYSTKDTFGVGTPSIIMDLFRTFLIIEYNGERWCDLNPAILDYLIEIKEIDLPQKIKGSE